MTLADKAPEIVKCSPLIRLSMVKRTLIAATAAQRRGGTPPPDRLRLCSTNKDELDRAVECEQRQGWVLVSRSYSMDDGHGAELVRKEMSKAA